MNKFSFAVSFLIYIALVPLNVSAGNRGPLVYTEYDAFPIFQADYYLRANPSVRERCGRNYECANNHYYLVGLWRGYKGSPTFDISEYAWRNPDVAKAYDYDYVLVAHHYMVNGLDAERQATRGDVFVPEEYMELNSDVARAQGDSDHYRAVRHWFYHGVNEGRPSSHQFKVRAYINNYGDLSREFNNDYAAGLIHWEVHGRGERRTNTN